MSILRIPVQTAFNLKTLFNRVVQDENLRINMGSSIVIKHLGSDQAILVQGLA